MYNKHCLFLVRALCVLCAASVPLFFADCDSSNARIVTIWTDQSVVALYAGYFNSAQDTTRNAYKAEVVYVDNASEYLAETMPQGKDGPDIVIGNWLNSTGTIALFKPIWSFYQKNDPHENVFYPGLLEDGQLKGDQVLLPVSFDAQLLVFDRSNAALLPDPFSLSMAELQETGAAYNLMQNGIWTRVGFSPLWNEDFLFLSTMLLGAGWREAKPIAWDDEKLKAAIEMLREWIVVANDSIQADEDFSFKYSYESPDKLAAGGRILFTVMRASDFFKLAEERRNALDFRWLEHEGQIVPAENIVYYGIYRKLGSEAKAAAFTNWFFNEESQDAMLAKGRATRSAETFFGIAGGFSAMRGVTETVFMRHYTGMLGHAPHGEKIVSPGVFPPFFPEMKKGVILPYLGEQIRGQPQRQIRSTNDINGNGANGDTLEARLSDWTRMK
jgi:hypothetical protein